MIARESQGRYHVGWSRQALLVAKEQMRHATSTEAVAVEQVQKDVGITAERDDKQYKDVADENAEPRVKKVKRNIVKLKGKQNAKVPKDVRQ